MTMRKLLIALAPSLLLVACATTQATASGDAPEERVYTTGSNIPRSSKPKGTVSEVSKEEMERMRDQSRASTGRGPGG